jgi:hypothetical protein
MFILFTPFKIYHKKTIYTANGFVFIFRSVSIFFRSFVASFRGGNGASTWWPVEDLIRQQSELFLISSHTVARTVHLKLTWRILLVFKEHVSQFILFHTVWKMHDNLGTDSLPSLSSIVWRILGCIFFRPEVCYAGDLGEENVNI